MHKGLEELGNNGAAESMRMLLQVAKLNFHVSGILLPKKVTCIWPNKHIFVTIDIKHSIRKKGRLCNEESGSIIVDRLYGL